MSVTAYAIRHDGVLCYLRIPSLLLHAHYIRAGSGQEVIRERRERYTQGQCSVNRPHRHREGEVKLNGQ
jgi:hypothetical protein